MDGCDTACLPFHKATLFTKGFIRDKEPWDKREGFCRAKPLLRRGRGKWLFSPGKGGEEVF